jgi:PilZ domain
MASRAKERITVKFDCTLAVGDDRKRCTIRNISRDGVLTVWSPDEFLDIPFRVGDKYPLEVRFSEHQQFGSQGLSCTGTVVRVAVDRQQVAFRISRARLGALGLAAFGKGDARGTYLM